MNTLTTKALIVLLSVLVLITIGSQIYFRINDRHKTEEAVLCDINENIPFKGVVVRGEKILESDVNGVYEYLYSNGSKLSPGSVIANVYPDEQTLLNKRKADDYKAKAAALENAQNPGNAEYVQPDTLTGRIDTEYKKLISSSLSGNRSDLEDSANELFQKMNIYNIITGQSANYSKEISELKDKASKLSYDENSVKTVEIDESGYFVSYCDGYESVLTPDKVNSLTRSDIEAVIDGRDKEEVPSKAIGKVFDDYSCNIVAVLPDDKRIVEGDTLKLRLGSSDNLYSVRIVSIGKADDEGKCVTVMSCNRLDSDIASSRVLSLELIFDDYHGIKVPRDAIRFKGEDKGVYVILGNDVTFKKIEVIYEGNDFVVLKNTSDSEYLLLYDQILLEAVSNQNESANESTG